MSEYVIPSLLSSAQYEMVYRQRPNDHLLCLSIATVYLNMAVQKHNLQKNALVLQVVTISQ